MGIFDSLQKTKTRKRLYNFDLQEIYRKGRFANDTDVDYEFFENLNANKLLELTKKSKNNSLIELWGKLDMKSYIDYDLGNTVNLYYINCNHPTPVKKLENYDYMPDDSRRMNLLDIKYIKKFAIEGLEFQNIYLATFEIMDPEEYYRPYVLFLTKNKNNEWIQIGYGYDSNDNGNVEIFMDVFNYPVFLTPKGYLMAPLSNKREKLDIYDYITEKNIKKLFKNQK